MAWELTGNAGTDPTTNFLGTTAEANPKPLVIKTNGSEQLRITPDGNVGIGITTPLTKLEVDGQTYINNITKHTFGNQLSLNVNGPNWGHFYEDGSERLYFGASDSLTAVPSSPIMTWDLTTGNVGIGTTNSTQALQVTGQGFFTSSPASPDPGDGSGTGIRIGYQSTDDYGYINANTTGIAAKRLILQQNGGNVGIGTTMTNCKLTVSGAETTPSGGGAAIQLTNSASGGTDWYLRVGATGTDTPVGGFSIANDERYCLTITRDGTVSTRDGSLLVGGDVILNGGDCAEEFDVAEAGDIEPGTVMVLDQDGALHQSQHAYDKRVAGVISGAGDYKPGLILDRRQSQDYRVPVALVGKVYCKVDAQYASIEVGDLLTTSSTPGHAMKADDPSKAFGSVIGKALRPLEAGQAMIPILIALQ